MLPGNDTVTPFSATVSAPTERRGHFTTLLPSLMESLLAIAAIAMLAAGVRAPGRPRCRT